MSNTIFFKAQQQHARFNLERMEDIDKIVIL